MLYYNLNFDGCTSRYVHGHLHFHNMFLVGVFYSLLFQLFYCPSSAFLLNSLFVFFSGLSSTFTAMCWLHGVKQGKRQACDVEMLVSINGLWPHPDGTFVLSVVYSVRRKNLGEIELGSYIIFYISVYFCVFCQHGFRTCLWTVCVTLTDSLLQLVQT